MADQPPMPACVRPGLILLGASYVPGIVDLVRGQRPPTPGMPSWFGLVVAAAYTEQRDVLHR